MLMVGLGGFVFSDPGNHFVLTFQSFRLCADSENLFRKINQHNIVIVTKIYDQ